MKSTKYSEKVLDHFRNPRNVGTLEGDDVASGRVGNPVCGDLMEVYIKVKDGRIVDAKFQTFGCGSAIATSSMTTEMVKGMTLEDAMKVTRKDVAEELDGLPPIKMHCSNLAADALHEAIKRYMIEHGLAADEELDAPVETAQIKGKEAFIGKGIFKRVDDYEDYRDLRVLVLYTGDESIRTAIKLTEYTNRVVLVTPKRKITTSDDLSIELDSSSVKVITEGEVVEAKGEGELEKVIVHNLDEDTTYELFIDALITME
ncbi:MAG: Fe-S cluster assembly scaffold protein NifU [Candidatus Thorarchaeota archaeon]